VEVDLKRAQGNADATEATINGPVSAPAGAKVHLTQPPTSNFSLQLCSLYTKLLCRTIA
jgi:hypothetical protein